MEAVAAQPEPWHIRPMLSGELGHVLHTWAEAYKHSPAMKRKLWSDYKARDVPQLAACLKRPDTTVIVAIGDSGTPIGWLAFARWPSIDAVHWAHTGLKHRHNGVATALFKHADLKRRLLYTHKAEAKRGTRIDELMSKWLERRGHVVSYTPYQEWAR